MKLSRFHRVSVATTAIALAFAVCVASINDVAAKPGGRYVCEAKDLNFNGGSWGGKTKMILRVPNGKGMLRGSFKGHQSTIGLGGGATPIKGRITNARSMQGGNKHVLKGRWTWLLSKNFLTGDARGRVRLVITHVTGGYDLKTPIRVRNNGAMPYVVTGKAKGDK